MTEQQLKKLIKKRPLVKGRIKETDIQRAIIQYLRYKGYFVWKQNNVGIKKANGSYIPTTMRGISDILGISKDGKFIAIEVKMGKNKPTEYQEMFLEEIKSRKGIAIVAYDLLDVQKWL